MAQRIKGDNLMKNQSIEYVEIGLKSGVGITGSLTAMTINDMVALIVGFLTGIYMLFQIEAAWRKRKNAIKKESENENN